MMGRFLWPLEGDGGEAQDTLHRIEAGLVEREQAEKLPRSV